MRRREEKSYVGGGEYFADQPRRGEVRGEETEERQGGDAGSVERLSPSSWCLSVSSEQSSDAMRQGERVIGREVRGERRQGEQGEHYD